MWDRRRVKMFFLVVLPLLALPVADWGFGKLEARYSIGVSIQKNRYCLPWHVFLIRKGDVDGLKVGDVVAFRDDDVVPEVYRGFTVVKMVMGVSGDVVEIADGELRINGEFVDRLWLLEDRPDLLRRKVRIEVGDGEYFLMGTSTDSLDSRYFGVVRRDRVVGRAVPLL